MSRWVLVELRVVILYVDVVADAEELLAILVAAGEQNGRHAHNVIHGKLAVIWRISLIKRTKMIGNARSAQKVSETANSKRIKSFVTSDSTNNLRY